MDPTYTQPGGLTARDPEAQKFLDFLWRCNNSEVFKCMEMESFTGILTYVARLLLSNLALNNN